MLQFKKGTLIITTLNQSYILDNEKQQYYNCQTKTFLQTAPSVSVDFCEADKEETDIFVLYLSKIIRYEHRYSKNAKSEFYQLRKHLISLEKFIRIASNNGCQLEYNGGIGAFFQNCNLLKEELPKNQIYKSWNAFLTDKKNSNLETIRLLNLFLDDYKKILKTSWVQNIDNSIPKEWISQNQYKLDVARRRYEDVEDRKIFLYYYYTQLGYLSNQFATISDYIDWCKEMGKTPKKVNNFLKEYGETARAIKQWRNKILNERISKVVDRVRKKLFYEDNDFITILPTTNQELVKEGNNMHHCVGSYGQNVANNDCYIVFIRKKDNLNKCYITAQVFPNGKIGYYCLAYDKVITEEKDIQFREKYQEHLNLAFNFNF